MAKIIKNIHPPKDPKNRKKLRRGLRDLAKKKTRNKMARESRKKNRM